MAREEEIEHNITYRISCNTTQRSCVCLELNDLLVIAPVLDSSKFDSILVFLCRQDESPHGRNFAPLKYHTRHTSYHHAIPFPPLPSPSSPFIKHEPHLRSLFASLHFASRKNTLSIFPLSPPPSSPAHHKTSPTTPKKKPQSIPVNLTAPSPPTHS